MKNHIIYLFTLCFALGYSQNSISEFTNSLDRNIPKQLKEKNVPGLAVAIIDNAEVIYKKGFGLADINNQIKITSETGFNIGSISKLFTAWGVMKLVEKGKLNLDIPVENYLTRWKLPESKFDKSKVTIRGLLGHTGGISVHGYPGFHPDAKLPTLEASLNGENGPVRANEKVELIYEPQTKFEYSGGGYTILQLVIEEVTGKSFEKYMQNQIFKPLKMKHTSFTINQNILKNSATPYDEDGKEVYFEVFTAKAAAGLQTTLEDMLIFVNASLKGNKILNKDTLQLMRKPSKLSRGNYGLGYIIFPLGDITVKGHTGTNTGWESAFLLDFEYKSGMIALTNASKNGEAVARRILREWVKWKTSQIKK
ncbi:class A beta-lactamase-related serine hydrolase [Flavobacteriaceae bacterium AU392]|nr:class A beta-lactamase-related serine hydrolase [Flavobacteriaceae bacterium]RKM83582.1 class A beta-lactamase-related serine hydrolase [Flavobacteriaceae bacterium AU392]